MTISCLVLDFIDKLNKNPHSSGPMLVVIERRRVGRLSPRTRTEPIDKSLIFFPVRSVSGAGLPSFSYIPRAFPFALSNERPFVCSLGIDGYWQSVTLVQFGDISPPLY